MFEKKITNNQNREADPRQHYHTQGFTCDCKHCGTEFSQYHAKHVFCSEVCSWENRGIELDDLQCVDCGCTDRVPTRKHNYRCDTCKKFKLNPDRTDIKRRASILTDH